MMYDENKWNENANGESSESVPEKTESADNKNEWTEAAKETSAADMSTGQETSAADVNAGQGTGTADVNAGQGIAVDSNTGTYRWSKNQENAGQGSQYGAQSQNYGQGNPQPQRNPQGAPNQSYGQYQYGQNSQPNRQTNQQYQYQYRPHQGYPKQNYDSGNQNPKKKGGFLKKAVMVTAAALLFGVVSGATMFGVNRVANLVFPMETSQEQQETQGALENTETIPSSQENAAVALPTGVVIEDVSPIVEAAMPSVVAVHNTTLYKSSTWFGQTQTYEVPSSGSGIIVGENDTELLIVTNHHVIEDSTALSVTFIDESTVDAAIKGTDSESDLAIIAVPLDQISADTKSQIKAATIGDSDKLKMGQGVIAIGNALGLGQSVTVGHVSALNREITVDGVTKTVIQTDAAINPGNSGGALLNAEGELIGINEAKYADESVEGVGYAIPISSAMDIIEDLKLRTTKVEVAEEEQGYLGIQVQNVDSATAEMLGMPVGVYVYKIMDDSAAAASDLREKDIITKFDGETVRNNADLTDLLTYYKAGTTVTLTVQSLENGTYTEREVEVTLKNRPAEDAKKQ